MSLRPARADDSVKRIHLGLAPGGARTESRPRAAARLADPYPLGPGARRVLRALVGALCPSLPSLEKSDVLERVDVGARRLLVYMHPVVARGLWLGLFVLDWLPVLTFRSAGRLHKLGPERAGQFVARWARSRVKALRLLVTGVRSLVLSVYFDQRDVHAAMRYAPEEFIQDRARLRRMLLAPARTAAE